jgi:hypothetical protein
MSTFIRVEPPSEQQTTNVMHTHPKRFSSIDVSRKLVLAILSHTPSKLLLFASSGGPMSRIAVGLSLAVPPECMA